MHTVIRSKIFQSKAQNKYSEEILDELIERISLDPRIGKKFQAVNNLYKIDLGVSSNPRNEYEVVYYFQNFKEPIIMINLFKKHEKDVLSKTVSVLVKKTL